MAPPSRGVPEGSRAGGGRRGRPRPPSQGGEEGDRRGLELLGSCLGEPRLQPAEAIRDPPGGQAGCERPQKIELEADSPDEEASAQSRAPCRSRRRVMWRTPAVASKPARTGRGKAGRTPASPAPTATARKRSAMPMTSGAAPV